MVIRTCGDFSKHREDGIANSSRNLTIGFECIIMKVLVSKHREKGIAKDIRNILNRLWSIMNVYVSCMYLRAYVVTFGYVTFVFVRIDYLWLGFIKLVYVWLCFHTFS